MMQNKISLRNAIFVTLLLGLAQISHAAQHRIRVPIVASQTTHDTGFASFLDNSSDGLRPPWIGDASTHKVTLGVTAPPTPCNLDGSAVFGKKVEVQAIIAHTPVSPTPASLLVTFWWKQQRKGLWKASPDISWHVRADQTLDGETGPNGDPVIQNETSWTQDGPYPYSAAEKNVNSIAAIYLWDNPSWGQYAYAADITSTGSYVYYNKSFQDKIKWENPPNSGTFYDVFKGDGSSDPYFDSWLRLYELGADASKQWYVVSNE